MSQNTSEHKPSTDPPGAVSDQNGEEAQSGHRKDGTHPEPRTGAGRAEKHDGSQHNESRDSGGVTGRQ